MPLDVSSLPPGANRRVRGVEPDMLTGGSHPERAPSGWFPSLLLVHGYCSGGNVWPAADFTQPKTAFLRPEREPDARSIRATDRAASDRGRSDFVRNRRAQPGRVRSAPPPHVLRQRPRPRAPRAEDPERGHAVPGDAARVVGRVRVRGQQRHDPRGLGDLARGIPSWARAEVYYWTTSNSGSACSIFTDGFLTNPRTAPSSSSAASSPARTRWAHRRLVPHDRDEQPRELHDHTRNQSMNAAAAR
jgi:hypothetical protein